MEAHRPTALETTATDLTAALSALAQRDLNSGSTYADLRWAFYLRMLNKPHLIAEAAGRGPHWYGDFDTDDFDAMQAHLDGRLAGPTTTLERAEIEAAITALDCKRQDKRTVESFIEDGE